jgi:hypothetical protein
MQRRQDVVQSLAVMLLLLLWKMLIASIGPAADAAADAASSRFALFFRFVAGLAWVSACPNGPVFRWSALVSSSTLSLVTAAAAAAVVVVAVVVVFGWACQRKGSNVMLYLGDDRFTGDRLDVAERFAWNRRCTRRARSADIETVGMRRQRMLQHARGALAHVMRLQLDERIRTSKPFDALGVDVIVGCRALDTHSDALRQMMKQALPGLRFSQMVRPYADGALFAWQRLQPARASVGKHVGRRGVLLPNRWHARRRRRWHPVDRQMEGTLHVQQMKGAF